jgi:hypothetical protein
MTTLQTHQPTSGQAARTWLRFLLLVAAIASVLLVGVSSAFANQPAMHFTQPIAGSDPLQCGDTTYTPISGELATVVHEGQSAAGNTNYTITITPRHVVLQDQDGNLYSVAGAIWFGGTFNANTGGFQATSTDKFQIISQSGGTVDSVNGVEHISPNGTDFSFDFGTCA